MGGGGGSGGGQWDWEVVSGRLGGQWGEGSEVVFEAVLLRGILTYYNSITNTKISQHNIRARSEQFNLGNILLLHYHQSQSRNPVT